MLVLHHSHPWDVSPGVAREIQTSLGQWIVLQDDLPTNVKTIAGVDRKSVV